MVPACAGIVFFACRCTLRGGSAAPAGWHSLIPAEAATRPSQTEPRCSASTQARCGGGAGKSPGGGSLTGAGGSGSGTAGCGTSGSGGA
ncbi:hypothetical protein UB46_18660 [Burkholderiaceae bacterium 16]|nr:hypothetical protein UB46_18660 [Burkholderiaceae bacterium 16]